MQLNRRQAQMLCNVAVLDCQDLINGLALDPERFNQGIVDCQALDEFD